MNAVRFARSLIEDGVDPKLAQSLSEHLADEIERTVATRDQVELVVTREVQQLRVEMHEQVQGLRSEVQGLRVEMHEQVQGLRSEVQGLRVEMHEQIQGLRSEVQGLRVEMHEQVQGLRPEMQRELRQLGERIDDKFTSQFRWMIGMFVTLMVGVVLNLGAVVLSIVVIQP